MRGTLTILRLLAVMSLAACAADVPTFDGRTDGAWEALGSVDDRTRIAAVRLVAYGGRSAPNESAARSLADAASDANPWVRRWAVAALGRGHIPAGLAVPALTAAAQDDMPGIREAALRSLGQLNEAAALAVPVLVSALDSERRSVALTAAWALGRIGKPAREMATPVLERVSEEGRGVSHGAWRALRRINHSLPTALEATRLREALTFDENVLVRIDHRGSVTVRGEILSPRDLKRHLRGRAEVARGNPMSDGLDVVLWLDEDLPWIVARAILTVCASTDVRLREFHLVVRRAEDGEPGVLSYPHRWDEMILDESGAQYLGPWSVRLDIGRGGEPFESGKLEEILRKTVGGLANPTLAICTDAGVPVREVVRCLGVACRVGIADVRFVDAGPDDLLDVTPSEWVRRLARRSNKRPGHMIFVLRRD